MTFNSGDRFGMRNKDKRDTRLAERPALDWFPSGFAGVWEDPNVVKAAPTLEPVPLMHCTTFVKCNSHERILSDVRF